MTYMLATLWETPGGLRLLVGLGDKLSGGKNKNRERDQALDFDGFFWMGGRNNQPKSGRIVRILLGEMGAQVDDDGGGRCRIVSVVKVREKNNKSKFVVALRGRQSTIAHNNQPN
jgi:hypothetical protein